MPDPPSPRDRGRRAASTPPRGRRPILFALFLAAALSGAALPAAAEDAVWAKAREAALAARAGRMDEALEAYAAICRERPTSIAAHGALARLAVASGRAETWRARVLARLASHPRDVGALAAAAEFDLARGRRDDARAKLLAAVAAGARDPELVPALVAASPRPAETIAWFAARAATPRADAQFAALRARLLLAFGEVRAARADAAAALARAPEAVEAVVLRLEFARADGEVEEACPLAAAAAGSLRALPGGPEARFRSTMAVVRALADCGRADDARRLLRAVRPPPLLPGVPPPSRALAVAEADAAIAEGDPLRALAVLAERGPLSEGDPEWGEPALSARVRALTALGLEVPDAPAIAGRPLPAGLLLAERSRTLAALAGSADPAARRAVAAALRACADRLAADGVEPRAGRAALLAGALAAAPEGGPAPAETAATPRPGAVQARRRATDLRAAQALLSARRLVAAGSILAAEDTASRGRVADPNVAPELLMALALEEAQAALAAKNPSAASAAARDGLAEHDRLLRGEEPPLAEEFRPLAGRPPVVAARLLGIGFRATLAAGRTPREAAEQFLFDAARIARGWTIVEAPWPATLAEVAEAVPADACLVFAAAGPDAPEIALDRAGGLSVAGPGGAAGAPECAGKRAVLWAGPASPPHGLALGPRDERALVRVVRPGPLAGAAAAKAAGAPAVVGAGPARARLELLEALLADDDAKGSAAPASAAEAEGRSGADLRTRRPGSAAPASAAEADGRRTAGPPDGGDRRDDQAAAGGWPVYVGLGIASAESPLASGWLVPPTEAAPDGWMPPQNIPQAAPAQGALWALGLAETGEAQAPERGAWLLAESALLSGRSWALFSRRPLRAAERAALLRRGAAWAENPLREARRLAKRDPALAEALALWTAPAPPPAPSGRGYYGLAAAMAVLGALATVFAVRAAARRVRRRPRS